MGTDGTGKRKFEITRRRNSAPTRECNAQLKTNTRQKFYDLRKIYPRKRWRDAEVGLFHWDANMYLISTSVRKRRLADVSKLEKREIITRSSPCRDKLLVEL